MSNKMYNDNLKQLVEITEKYNLNFPDVHKLYELNTMKLVNRDHAMGKTVDYLNPQQQYDRSFEVIKEYIRRKL